MEALLIEILKNLVEDEDSVNVESEITDSSVLFIVRVADGDVGRVIGKSGSIANSIRRILRAMSPKLCDNKNVQFDVVEKKIPYWNPDLQED